MGTSLRTEGIDVHIRTCGELKVKLAHFIHRGIPRQIDHKLAIFYLTDSDFFHTSWMCCPMYAYVISTFVLHFGPRDSDI